MHCTYPLNAANAWTTVAEDALRVGAGTGSSAVEGTSSIIGMGHASGGKGRWEGLSINSM